MVKDDTFVVQPPEAISLYSFDVATVIRWEGEKR